jgi:pimeloyl-ACP methyl ester carboxylesterase
VLQGSINHVSITVSDLRSAMAFFGPLLEFLGYTVGEITYDRRSLHELTVNINEANGTAVNVWQAEPGLAEHPFEVYEPGLHHVAWNVERHEQVDARQRAGAGARRRDPRWARRVPLRAGRVLRGLLPRTRPIEVRDRPHAPRRAPGARARDALRALMHERRLGPLGVREHGGTGLPVLVLHGGPGAPGSATELAAAVGDAFHVLEPLQRRRGAEPLTVRRHVEDLLEVIEALDGERPALVGHSWGAMLALAVAAAHPGRVASLALIGCGTFDPVARDRLREIRSSRMGDEVRARLERLDREIADPDQRLRAMGELIGEIDSYDAVAAAPPTEPFDAQGSEETWQDMVRLQAEGVYPAAFSAIDAPVVMLHGAFDPHPGPLIRASLAPHVRRLEYREWERCGHTPWLERAVRDDFLATLRETLTRR